MLLFFPPPSLKLERFKNLTRPLKHGGLSPYRTINYYEMVSTATICEKPDVSVLGTDLFYKEWLGEN